MISADSIREKLPSLDQVASRLYGINFKNGVARCPFPENHHHGDRSPSLRFDKQKDRIFDPAQNCFGEKGVDAFGLVAIMDGTDFAGACVRLAEFVGEASPSTRSSRTATSAREALARDGFIPNGEYYISDDLRKVRFLHTSRVQIDKDRPEKTFRWEHRAHDGVWYSGDGGKPKDLPYANREFRTRDEVGTVVAVEGEAKADAIGDLGFPAISFRDLTAKGAEVVAGADVYVWPDNDAAGRKKALTVASLIRPHARTVYMLEPPENIGEAGDVVDAIARLGWRAGDVSDFLQTARPYDSAHQQATQEETPTALFRIDEIPSVESYAARAITFLVPGILAEAAVTAITGDAGSGKTTVVNSWCGEVSRIRPVLILDRENPLAVVRERQVRLRIKDGDNLRIWGGWLPQEPVGPASAILSEWVRSCDQKPLIVFDSWIGFLEGDENDASVVRQNMKGCRHLADLGATVIIIHHSGKSDSSREYRGSSDFKASIDIGYHLSNLSGDTAQLSTLRLKAFKARFLVDSDIVLRYEHGSFLRDERPTAQTVTDSLRNLLIANPSVRVADFENLAVAKGLGRNQARTFLGNGVLSGAVRQDKGSKNARYHTWNPEANS